MDIISYETIGDYIKYNCTLTQSYFIFKKCENKIIYDSCHFDWENPKIILNFIKNVFQNIINTGADIFCYEVLNDELNFIDITKWIIVEKHNYSTLLECDINIAFDNFVYGFITNN